MSAVTTLSSLASESFSYILKYAENVESIELAISSIKFLDSIASISTENEDLGIKVQELAVEYMKREWEDYQILKVKISTALVSVFQTDTLSLITNRVKNCCLCWKSVYLRPQYEGWTLSKSSCKI